MSDGVQVGMWPSRQRRLVLWASESSFAWRRCNAGQARWRILAEGDGVRGSDIGGGLERPVGAAEACSSGSLRACGASSIFSPRVRRRALLDGSRERRTSCRFNPSARVLLCHGASLAEWSRQSITNSSSTFPSRASDVPAQPTRHDVFGGHGAQDEEGWHVVECPLSGRWVACAGAAAPSRRLRPSEASFRQLPRLALDAKHVSRPSAR